MELAHEHLFTNPNKAHSCYVQRWIVYMSHLRAQASQNVLNLTSIETGIKESKESKATFLARV